MVTKLQYAYNIVSIMFGKLIKEKTIVVLNHSSPIPRLKRRKKNNLPVFKFFLYFFIFFFLAYVLITLFYTGHVLSIVISLCLRKS